MNRRRNSSKRSGFTLVEALVSISIMVIAGSALLAGLSSSLQTTTYSLDQTIAIGMAEQLMDEIASTRYAYPSTEATQPTSSFGPDASEILGTGRELYNDIDDFHRFSAKPPQDLWGASLGADDGEGNARHPAFQIPSTYFRYWRQEVRVYYVDDDDPSQEITSAPWSNMRAVEIDIYYDDPTQGSRRLANLRRVFAFIPRS